MNLRSIVTVQALLALVTCSEPLEFPEWTIPVREGTRVVEYADATDDEREGNRIELVEDLVIGPRAGDDDYSLYRPTQVLTDSAGRIYVFDSGNARIQVFNTDGEYVRTLGGAGSGPGEFQSRGGFTTAYTVVAADRLIAYDMAQSRISAWAADGTFEGDHAATGFRLGPLLAGLDDGTLLTVATDRTDDVSSSVLVAASEAGERLRDYVSLPRPGNFQVGSVGLLNPAGGPVFAAASDGAVYASAGDEYQVLALGPGGEATWALRVAHERAPFTDEHRTRIIEVLTGNFPGLDPSGTDWPTHLASISQIAVDGHGHLFVFGASAPFGTQQERIEVDVYSPDGERLFTGTMEPLRWTDAAGDFVYSLRTNEDTGEMEPVRYRLVEPFGR